MLYYSTLQHITLIHPNPHYNALQQNKGAREWAMQFYKYPAALLLESRGGEGGEAIPDVSVIPSFVSPLRTRT